MPQDQWETVLNKASIVEREAKLDEDRYKIARGIENRLDRQMPLADRLDHRLRAGRHAGRRRPTRTTTRTTRTAPTPDVGLPPDPIASPGAVSIDAVMHPADGPWIFWVTVNPETGETLFTDSSEEQNANIQKLRDWNAANGK